MYRYALFIVLFLLTALSQTHAETTVAEERGRLTALQQSLTRQQSDLKEMRAELDTYPAKLAEAEEALLRAEQEVATLQRDLATMQRQAEKEDSLQLNRDIALKEHAISMAERRVRSETRMLERYRRYDDSLREDVAKGERDVAQLNRRIADQQQRVAFAEGQTTSVSSAASTPQPVIQAPASAPSRSVAAAQARVATTEASPPALSQADYDALALADTTISRVETLITSNPSAAPRYNNLQLTGSEIPTTTFDHLGAEQYQAEVVLPSGSHRFRIDSLRFRVQIPTEDAGETFVFIVDASDRPRLKAFYFKKALLAYRDQKPVVAKQTAERAPVAAPVETVKLASGQTIALNEDDAFALDIARDHVALLSDLNLDINQGQNNSRYSISGNLIDNTNMTHLGQDQYLAEVTIQSGRQSIRINRSNFRIEVPEADDGEVYLFFVDASQPNRLQMTFYKKALLQYL